MKKIIRFHYLLIVTLWLGLSGCAKENVYINDYLSDDGFNVSLKGTSKGQVLDEQISMKIFPNYDESYFFSNKLRSYMRIKRLSSDGNSNIGLSVSFDENDAIESCTLYYTLNILDSRTKHVSDIYYYTTLAPTDLSGFKWDRETGEIWMKFEFAVNEDEDDYVIAGEVNCVVYERNY